jgi:hypothetical protein
MIRVRSQIGAISTFVASQNTTFVCAVRSMMNAEHPSLAMFNTTMTLHADCPQQLLLKMLTSV